MIFGSLGISMDDWINRWKDGFVDDWVDGWMEGGIVCGCESHMRGSIAGSLSATDDAVAAAGPPGRRDEGC